MNNIFLNPVKMTPQIMQMLEDKKLIIRLCPSNHRCEVEKHGCVGTDIYISDEKLGAHKLISVVVDRIEFSAFGTHEDNEEFMLIGGENEKTMYLLIALCFKNELEEKIRTNTLSAEDFICLECKFNDPYVSFFTMLKDVPHGEATKDEDKLPASFYVTEPAKMGIDLTDFKDYKLIVK